ncbi:NAD-P-binding protein [Trametopsis cervina]|nr:NAD-P-binding protein [Trametopsis cervina]
MSSRLFARALLPSPSSSSAAAVIPRASTSAARARLPMRPVLGASVRWNSAAADKARAAKILPDFSLAGKVCLVTGGARGLGLEFCRAFIQSGCTSLAIVDLKEDEASAAAEELIKQACVDSDMTESDYSVIGIGCDVSSELSVQQAFRRVMDTYGRIDSVAASAGIVENYTAFDYPFDRIKRLYDINVHGAFFTAREAARNMIPQGGGSIILVGSMSANIVNIPQPQTPYNAAKAAVKHMAASLAVEWAKKGVRVNCLSPGYMLTKLTRTILAHDEELKRTWESLTPMGRMGEPEDLSGAIVFLASDASRFMTGSEIRVDGGYCVI